VCVCVCVCVCVLLILCEPGNQPSFQLEVAVLEGHLLARLLLSGEEEGVKPET
jgi:hypothetical protein